MVLSFVVQSVLQSQAYLSEPGAMTCRHLHINMGAIKSTGVHNAHPPGRETQSFVLLPVHTHGRLARLLELPRYGCNYFPHGLVPESNGTVIQKGVGRGVCETLIISPPPLTTHSCGLKPTHLTRLAMVAGVKKGQRKK